MSQFHIFFKFYKLLPIKYKIALILLIPAILFSSSLEVISIATMIPLVGSVLFPEKISFLKVFDLTGMKFNTLLIAIGFLFIFKTIISSCLLYYITKMIYLLRAWVNSKLANNLIYREINDISFPNEPETIRLLSNDVEQFQNGFLSPILIIFSDIILISIMIIFFGYQFGLLFLFIFSMIILFPGILIYFFRKKFLIEQGQQRLHYETNALEKIRFIFRGIKEIKVQFLQKKLNVETSDIYYKLHIKNTNGSFWKQFPRLLIELLALLFVLCLFVYSFGSNTTPELQIANLSALGLSGFKLLPSASRIFGNLNQLNFSNEPIQRIMDNIEFEKNLLDEKQYFKELVSIQIKKQNFKSENRKIDLDIPNITFNKGEIIGVSGKSGLGKTSFVDSLLGINPDIKLQMKLFKKNSKNFYDLKNGIYNHLKCSYVSQNPVFVRGSIKKNALIVNNFIDKEIYLDNFFSILENFDIGLDHLPKEIICKDFDGDLNDYLSGGQLQRIAIARMLALKNEVIIFDESTSALDDETQKLFLDYIKSTKKSRLTIMITHRKNNKTYFDKTLNFSKKSVSLS